MFLSVLILMIYPFFNKNDTITSTDSVLIFIILKSLNKDIYFQIKKATS